MPSGTVAALIRRREKQRVKTASGSDLEVQTYVVKKRRRRGFGSVGAAHGSVAAGGVGGGGRGQLVGWSGWMGSALALLFLSGAQATFGQHNLETDTAFRAEIQYG